MNTSRWLKSVQIAYHLTLTVTVKRNDEIWAMTTPLVQLTTLIFWLWSIQQSLDRGWFELIARLENLTVTLLITLKVMVIIGSSLAYGLGMIR